MDTSGYLDSGRQVTTAYVLSLTKTMPRREETEDGCKWQAGRETVLAHPRRAFICLGGGGPRDNEVWEHKHNNKQEGEGGAVWYDIANLADGY